MKTLDSESLCLNCIETEMGVEVTQTGQECRDNPCGKVSKNFRVQKDS